MNEGGSKKTSSEAEAARGYSNDESEEDQKQVRKEVRSRKMFNFNRATKRPAILNCLE